MGCQNFLHMLGHSLIYRKCQHTWECQVKCIWRVRFIITFFMTVHRYSHVWPFDQIDAGISANYYPRIISDPVSLSIQHQSIPHWWNLFELCHIKTSFKIFVVALTQPTPPTHLTQSWSKLVEVGQIGIKNESHLVMTNCDSFLIPVWPTSTNFDQDSV